MGVEAPSTLTTRTPPERGGPPPPGPVLYRKLMTRGLWQLSHSQGRAEQLGWRPVGLAKPKVFTTGLSQKKFANSSLRAVERTRVLLRKPNLGFSSPGQTARQIGRLPLVPKGLEGKAWLIPAPRILWFRNTVKVPPQEKVRKHSSEQRLLLS